MNLEDDFKFLTADGTLDPDKLNALLENGALNKLLIELDQSNFKFINIKGLANALEQGVTDINGKPIQLVELYKLASKKGATLPSTLANSVGGVTLEGATKAAEIGAKFGFIAGGGMALVFGQSAASVYSLYTSGQMINSLRNPNSPQRIMLVEIDMQLKSGDPEQIALANQKLMMMAGAAGVSTLLKTLFGPVGLALEYGLKNFSIEVTASESMRNAALESDNSAATFIATYYHGAALSTTVSTALNFGHTVSAAANGLTNLTFGSAILGSSYIGQ
ncbi:MAG: hypothetical protein Q9M91_03835 [Candidatus Dojkabacteria bacterium]|nr:hypothetical protein [Candidatus Dojkabacteria bacterium]MDQ7020944.1 hypothetical protein [Candidatus Dojkabacteria bacterium]